MLLSCHQTHSAPPLITTLLAAWNTAAASPPTSSPLFRSGLTWLLLTFQHSALQEAIFASCRSDLVTPLLKALQQLPIALSSRKIAFHGEKTCVLCARTLSQRRWFVILKLDYDSTIGSLGFTAKYLFRSCLIPQRSWSTLRR